MHHLECQIQSTEGFFLQEIKSITNFSSQCPVLIVSVWALREGNIGVQRRESQSPKFLDLVFTQSS